MLPQDLSRKDCLEAPGSSLGDLPPASSKLSSSPSAVGTLKRPTSLSRHASAAGFPLTAGAPRAMPKGHKTPTSYSPMEGGEGPFIDVEDISQLLTDVARFADALENLRDVVLRDGGCRGGAGRGGRLWAARLGHCRHPPPHATSCTATRLCIAPWHGAAGHQGRGIRRGQVQEHPELRGRPRSVGGGLCPGWEGAGTPGAAQSQAGSRWRVAAGSSEPG